MSTLNQGILVTQGSNITAESGRLPGQGQNQSALNRASRSATTTGQTNDNANNPAELTIEPEKPLPTTQMVIRGNQTVLNKGETPQGYSIFQASWVGSQLTIELRNAVPGSFFHLIITFRAPGNISASLVITGQQKIGRGNVVIRRMFTLPTHDNKLNIRIRLDNKDHDPILSGPLVPATPLELTQGEDAVVPGLARGGGGLSRGLGSVNFPSITDQPKDSHGDPHPLSRSRSRGLMSGLKGSPPGIRPPHRGARGIKSGHVIGIRSIAGDSSGRSVTSEDTDPGNQKPLKGREIDLLDQNTLLPTNIKTKIGFYEDILRETGSSGGLGLINVPDIYGELRIKDISSVLLNSHKDHAVIPLIRAPPVTIDNIPLVPYCYHGTLNLFEPESSQITISGQFGQDNVISWDLKIKGGALQRRTRGQKIPPIQLVPFDIPKDPEDPEDPQGPKFHLLPCLILPVPGSTEPAIKDLPYLGTSFFQLIMPDPAEVDQNIKP